MPKIVFLFNVCEGVDATGHEYENDDVEINVGQGKLRGCIEADSDGLKIMAEAGVDAANGNVDLGKDVNVGASIGLSVDTGIDVGVDAVDVKLGGVGGSVGCKNEVCLWFGCITFTVCWNICYIIYSSFLTFYYLKQWKTEK